MAVTATPIFPQSIVNSTVVIPGTTTTQTLITAGTNGTKVENISVSSTCASNVTINLYLTISATQYLLTQYNIPANSGNSTTIPAVSLLNNTQISLNYDNNGNKYYLLASGSSLQATATATFTGNVTFASQGDAF